MKLLLIALAVTLVLAFSVSAQRPAAPAKPLTWTNFTSTEGGFSVKFPGTPVTRDETVPGNPARIKHIVEYVQANARRFTVSWTDMTGVDLNGDDMTEESIRSFVSDTEARGGKTIYRSNFTRETCFGKEASMQIFKNRQGTLLHARTFVSGERVFLIIYSSESSAGVDPKTKEQFLDSFSVTGKCELKWYDFRSSEGGFTAKFPLKPRATSLPIDPERPDFVRNLIELTTNQARHYEINYMGWEGSLDSVELAKIDSLTTLIDSFKNAGGEMLTREDLKRGGCQGEQTTLRVINPVTSKPALLKAQILSSYKTIYLVFFVGNSASADEGKLADEFLNSFVLAGDCRSIFQAKPVASNEPMVPATLDIDTGWQRIVSPHGISFMMPAVPRLESESRHSTSGILFQHVYFLVNEDHTFTIELIETGRKPSEISRDDMQRDLESFAKDFTFELARSGITASEGRSIAVGALIGKEFVLASDRNGFTGRARLIMAQGKLIRFTVLVPATTEGRANMTRFIDSLKIDLK